MKRLILFWLVIFLFLISQMIDRGYASEKKNKIFYTKSLHFSGEGMKHWYSKETGGIEKLTGIPYENLGCKRCHVRTCDICHRAKKDNVLFYSVKAAKGRCLKCHVREKKMLMLMKKLNIKDVHFSKGLTCVTCHTPKEIHGDGKKYVSMREPGAMETKCENCHEPPRTKSHFVHRGKLDCTACHVRQVLTCANCHMDLMIKEGKKKGIPLYGWVFLINYNGKVVSGNIQTFVVNKNQTFMIFVPYFSHDVTKEGRKCKDCHATDIIKQIETGKIKIISIENGKLKNIQGVIPVVENVKYESDYMDYKNGKWIPLKNPEPPIIQFPAFGKPLTQEQLHKLTVPFGR